MEYIWYMVGYPANKNVCFNKIFVDDPKLGWDIKKSMQQKLCDVPTKL